MDASNLIDRSKTMYFKYTTRLSSDQRERAAYTGSLLSGVWNNESCGWWDYVELTNEAGEKGGGEAGRAGVKEGRIKSSFGAKVFDRTGRNYQLVTLKNVGP